MKLRSVLMDAVTVTAGACAVILTVIVVTGGNAPVQSSPFDREDRRVDNWEEYLRDGRRLGAENGAVTVIEFGDYECPACRRIQPEIDRLLSEFPNVVTVVYRHWPLSYHQAAYPAARAAECAAEQHRFAEFHRLLYADSKWLLDPFPTFRRYAEQSGVPDMPGFENCISNEEKVPQIERGIEDATRLQAVGTPAFIVNGILLGRIPTYTEFTNRFINN